MSENDTLPARSKVEALLRRAYDLTLRGDPLILEGGKDNTNIRVSTDQGEFVLRRYDVCMHVRVEHELCLVNALARAGYPTPKPVVGSHGGWLCTWGGRPAALFPFITGTIPSAYDADLARAIGGLMGRLHTITAHLTCPLRRTNDLSELKRALGHHYRPGLRGIGWWRQIVSTFLKRHGSALKHAFRAIPSRIIHHDLHRLNILVDGENRPCTVLDFGESCVAPFVIDIARACHYIAADRSDYRLPEPFRDSFLEGYDESRRISKEKLGLLPLLFDLVNLADAARFLKSPPDDVKATEECRSLMIYNANRSDS